MTITRNQLRNKFTEFVKDEITLAGLNVVDYDKYMDLVKFNRLDINLSHSNRRRFRPTLLIVDKELFIKITSQKIKNDEIVINKNEFEDAKKYGHSLLLLNIDPYTQEIKSITLNMITELPELYNSKGEGHLYRISVKDAYVDVTDSLFIEKSRYNTALIDFMKRLNAEDKIKTKIKHIPTDESQYELTEYIKTPTNKLSIGIH